MKFDFESLSTEPLFYMLMHSAAFVLVLGTIFFIIGLLFGHATWGRYKRLTRELRGEAEALKDEIAGLKRKVGDQSVKSGPALAMATETIYMPKKEGTTAAEAVPAVTAETLTTREVFPPHAQAQEVTAPAIAENVPSAEAPAPKDDAAPKPAADESLPPPARHGSPLAEIIAPHPFKEPHAAPAGLGPDDTLPELIELPVAPLPAVEVQAELDPKLGLIYKTRPEKVDDLTELKGIAVVLEKRLHAFGIYTYAQIAAWDEEQIKEVSSRLAFKDRIQREHWVEQARQLSVKKQQIEPARGDTE
jgi:predicted flap endonuclease-1-like 5' DNA nuclease